MKTTLRSLSAGWLMVLATNSGCVWGGEVEDRHHSSPLIAARLTFLPHHPAVRLNKDLQKPWRDVRFLILSGNRAVISGYVLDEPGKERLVRHSVPTDAAPRAQFWEKILAAKKNRETVAQAAARETRTSQIPPGWDAATTKHFPELTTRRGEAFQNLYLRPLGNLRYEGRSGQAPVSLTIYDLPGPAAVELGSVAEIVQAFGMVANASTQLRRWDSAQEGGANYQDSAKDPLPGSVFAALRPGYIVLDMRWKATPEVAGAELLKPFSERKFATISASDFTHLNAGADWWNVKGVTPRLREDMPPASSFLAVPPTEQTILKDPFEGTATILANRKGEMKKIWAAETSQHRKVAIVETEGGYFYGYLETIDPLDETQLNWIQATQSQKEKFALQKTRTDVVSDKKKLLSLLDHSATRSLANPLITVERARIAPAHLKRILDGGMPALLVELSVPPGDGIEIPAQAESSGAGAGIEIQKVTDGISVYPETWDASLFRFRVATDQRVREVEYKRSAGRIQTIEKPWRKRETSEFVELPADLDGGLRLTDGRQIFELVPDRLGKLQVHTWEVVPNGLAR